MSSGSHLSDNNSFKEDIELTEFRRMTDSYSDSESNTDITSSYRSSTTETETSEGKASDSAVSFLNSSDEKNLSLKTSELSLELLENKPFRKKTLDRRASSLKERTIRKVSSLDSLRPSTKRIQFLNTLEGPLIRRSTSLNSLKELSTRRIQSLDPLNGSLTSMVSSLKTMGQHSTMVSSKDLLEGYSTSGVSSYDPLEGSSTSYESSAWLLLSQGPLEGPSTRTVSLSDSLPSVSQSHSPEPETEAHLNRVFTNERNGYCSRALAWSTSFLIRYSRQIRHSVFYPWFIVFLMILPYSAGYMGCMNLHLCDACPYLPNFLFMSGILGLCILFLHLVTVLSMRHFSPPFTGQEFRTCKRTAYCALSFILFMQMTTVFVNDPAFTPAHEKFCHKVFYNYTYYASIATPFIIVLLLLINVPRYYDFAENH